MAHLKAIAFDCNVFFEDSKKFFFAVFQDLNTPCFIDETFAALENGDWFLTGVFAFGVVVVGYCGLQITESCVNTLQQDL